MNKKISTSIILVVIVVLAVLAVGGIIYYKNKVKPIDVGKELSDKELLDYAKSKFNKEEMVFKQIIIGKYHGIPVKVSFSCSDVCPDYTIRIIEYDVELDKCEEAGGIKKAISVPSGIASAARGFCFPEIFVSNNIYEFMEDWNLLLEELQQLKDQSNTCTNDSDCSYQILNFCYMPVIQYNKNADLTEFNKKLSEYKNEFPSCDEKQNIKVNYLACEANKCIITYSSQ